MFDFQVERIFEGIDHYLQQLEYRMPPEHVVRVSRAPLFHIPVDLDDRPTSSFRVGWVHPSMCRTRSGNAMGLAVITVHKVMGCRFSFRSTRKTHH
jgi:hypothetical protein